MATERQKEAARSNIARAREMQGARARGARDARPASGLTTADKDRLRAADFAFPRERKEPLVDAGHVRNAIARFDQVEGVSDAERDQAWRRITAAARKFEVEVSARDWRELFEGGRARRR